MTKCEWCGTTLVGQQKKYCSGLCCSKMGYRVNSEKHIISAKLWQKNNPEKTIEIGRRAVKKYVKNNREKFNASMLNSYHNNKKRWYIRSLVYRNKKFLLNMYKHKCTICKKQTDKLHLVVTNYRWNNRNIGQARINDNKDKVKTMCPKCRKIWRQNEGKHIRKN